MLPSTTNGAQHTPPAHGLDLHVVANGRWFAIDLDEMLEAAEFAGLPGELIVTYVDAGGRRRYVERCPSRKPGRGA